MGFQLFPPKDTPYHKSKEYLDRQQLIDYFLVLSKILEAGTQTDSGTIKIINAEILKIIDKLK